VSDPYGVFLHDYKGIFALSDNEVYVASGERGLVLGYDGSQWTPMNTGLALTMRDVWASSSSNVIAVGDSGNIMQFNGTDWNSMPSGVTNSLNGIWGSSPSDIVAVGANGTILHYGGTSWQPDNSAVSNTLYSVWGVDSSNIWAVGENVILKYNGDGTWSTSYTGNETFYGIWGSNVNDIYAVGYYISFSPLEIVSSYFHYDGVSWIPLDINAATPFGTMIPLDVCGNTADNIYIVGGGNILHYDGNQWAIAGNEFEAWNLNNCEVSPNGTLYTSGEQVLVQARPGGSRKTVIPFYWPFEYHEFLSGIDSGLNSDMDELYMFSVGENGAIKYLHNNVWYDQSSPTSNDLYGVWMASAPPASPVTKYPDNVFAVGQAGTIIHYDGSKWETMTSPTGNNLWRVWGTGPNDVFAVGENGTIIHYDGISWSPMTIGTAANIYTIYGTASNYVFTSSVDGWMHFFDGFNWLLDDPGLALDVWGIASGGTYLAVGPGGSWALDGGTTGWVWDSMTATTEDLYGLDGLGDFTIYNPIAVGINGAIVRYDGFDWYFMDSGTSVGLWDVSCSIDWNMSYYACTCGEYGTLLCSEP